MSRPNILLIMPDQLRGDSLGCTSNGLVSTPNIDRIASEGALFRNAYSQSPLCQPARASFLTGRYPHQHGCVVNERTFPSPEHPNILRSISDSGYRTACVGKVHVGVVPKGTSRLPFLQGYGFDEMDEAFGKMAYLRANNRYTDLLQEAGVLEAFRRDLLERLAKAATDNAGDFFASLNVDGIDAKDPWYAAPAPVPEELFIDNYVGDLAVDWLRRYDSDDPFFLWVGFCGPHDPHDAPQRYADPYLEAGDALPVGSLTPPENTPSERYNGLLDYFRKYSGTGRMTEDDVRRLRAFYYGGITLIDDRIGDILAVLEERGMLDNTLIVFTSDHGDVLGDHQLLAKVVMYEGSVRVPLIVRPPGGAAATVVDAPVELGDAGATMVEAAGADPVRGSEAVSLLGAARDGAPDAFHEAIYSEVMAFSGVITDRYKYVVERDTGTPCALFDLAEDPAEDVNLAASPDHEPLRRQLHEERLAPFLAR